jgi:hypothetical protein
MPAVSKNGPCLFLGLELATDQLRASIVDETLELVGVECVDFDSELSEYQCVACKGLSWRTSDSAAGCPEPRAEYLLHQEMRTLHQWICGLKLWVRSYMFLVIFLIWSTESNFVSYADRGT